MRFRSEDFEAEDKCCLDQPKKFVDDELKALLNGVCCLTQEGLSKILQAAGFI